MKLARHAAVVADRPRDSAIFAVLDPDLVIRAIRDRKNAYE